MSTIKKYPAPWSPLLVERLNAYQIKGEAHPYTCGRDSNHRPLLATEEGWECLDCNYTQNWCHYWWGIWEENQLKEMET